MLRLKTMYTDPVMPSISSFMADATFLTCGTSGAYSKRLPFPRQYSARNTSPTESGESLANETRVVLLAIYAVSTTVCVSSSKEDDRCRMGCAGWEVEHAEVVN